MAKPKLLHIKSPQNNGGYTVAFVEQEGVYHVALSVCRATQKFSPVLGEKVALQRLAQGNYMTQTKDKLLSTLSSLAAKLSSNLVVDESLLKD